MKIPEFNKDFFCIANIDEPILSAIVSSYANKKGFYTPMFEFPSVTAADNNQSVSAIDEHHLTRNRARQLSIKIGNTIRRLRGCDNILLIGLTKDQRSYLKFPKDYNIIEINDISDATFILGSMVEKSNTLSCKESQIYVGLVEAMSSDSILHIDDNADDVVHELNNNGGIVVIENVEKVGVVIAINYGISINANIFLTNPLKIDKRKISTLIDEWKNGDQNSFNDLSSFVYPNIETIEFKDYDFATFFTEGAPYSLILKNVIPFSHVHLHLNPDFFIFNNLYFEAAQTPYSAIVFSPLEFKDEETNFVIDELTKKSYYVKELVGENATSHNINYHVREYPFNLLHICSHGGEVDGYSVKHKFIDSNGDEHIVEYDEVVSFAPSKLEEKIPVTSKKIWKKFDGYVWRSKELKAIEFPQYVYADMLNSTRNIDKEERKPKKNISNSCAIKCSDFNYQAMFHHLAASRSPLIFNNTCWSWSDIADSFIAVGARGYIGTLWNINNSVAVKSAEVFYENLFNTTILDAFSKLTQETISCNDEDIYIFWGLHFSTFKQVTDVQISKNTVVLKLIESLNVWKEKLENTSDVPMRENIERIINWIAHELATNYKKETLLLTNNLN
ncbi:hypothetical protein KO494_02935 [Lacinutrix sp. C3R15]|uniref:hypothetical protein n=1 Tax=Flavobacteriaceae TaxID=49546 RepID=UPI001C0A4DF7|nr:MULTISPECIES: hypothetical protein [Flavobacteriaceae]MBU2938485.1 hypothetical protein [Lacinutrix sp. C3R15]MDO6621799.1 hypothetical protein [Oceanihabitans sp. 1_MG-2023]